MKIELDLRLHVEDEDSENEQIATEVVREEARVFGDNVRERLLAQGFELQQFGFSDRAAD